MGNCVRVKDNNRLGTQKSVSFDFDDVTWLKYCRYSVKHYPINQSKYSVPIYR